MCGGVSKVDLLEMCVNQCVMVFCGHVHDFLTVWILREYLAGSLFSKKIKSNIFKKT